MGSIGFTGYTKPTSNTKALNQFKNVILPGKDEQLKPAKKNDKTTVLLVVLDYPLLDANSLAKLLKESKCTNIDHVYLARSWFGGPYPAKIEKAS